MADRLTGMGSVGSVFGLSLMRVAGGSYGCRRCNPGQKKMI